METNNKHSFIKLDPALQIMSPSLPAGRYNRHSWLNFGLDNKFGIQMFDLYRNCTLLKACIDITCDEVTEDEFMKDVVRSLILYGAAPLLVRKQGMLRPTMALLDHRFLRITGDRSKFRYQPYQQSAISWTNDPSQDEYIIYIALDDLNPYATPYSYPSIKAAQCLVGVFESHVSELSNSFSSSCLLTLNNGVPDDETARSIERDLNNKYAGSSNSGRIMISFANSKDEAAELTPIPTVDYDSKYTNLLKTCQDQILANFRCTSVLLGLSDEFASSFDANEYSFQFSLFKHFTIIPLQRKLMNLWQKAGLGIPPLKPQVDSLQVLVQSGLNNQVQQDTKDADDEVSTSDQSVEE